MSIENFTNYQQTVQAYNQTLQTYSKQSIEIKKLIISMKNFIRSEKNEFKLNKFSEEFDLFIRNASQLYSHLEKSEFEVAVMGKEKAGKSTLLNALLNLPILPNEQER